VSIATAIGSVLFVLGLIYALLGFVAYFHVSKEQHVDKGWALSLVWSLNEKSYDEYGKKLCAIGKPLFFVVWGGFLIWLILKAA
jgi:Ca2+/Na+ antiporter